VHAYDGESTSTHAESLLEASLLEGDDELLDTVTYAVEGSAAEVLVAAAERDRADEIVVGTRGRGRVESALLGSVAQAVVDASFRPVVVVPSG
jgi:nucleotide-binding universal stress UspA family protein